jgi:rare lipoprotein A
VRLRAAPGLAVAMALLLLAGCSHQPRTGAPASTPARTDAPRPDVDGAPTRAEPTRPAAGVPGIPEAYGSRGNMASYEVFGRRYHTLTTSRGYRERGVASWYGTKFHGRSTSSGEPYDMHAMTAAHKSLPLPSWAEVHNLSNGKRIVVRVNDRGPFVGNRIIDLSYAAAREIGMIADGTALVEVRTLHDPSEISAQAIVYTANGQRSTGAQFLAERASPGRTPGLSPVAVAVAQPTPAAPPARAQTPPGKLFVQVGAFAQRDNAERLTGRLAADGFANSFILDDTQVTPTMYRVRIGPIVDVAAYDAAVTELAELGIFETRLITE